MTKLRELSNLGQSVWLDFIRRSFINSGGLKALVDEGLGGVTSNPTIFEKAIAGSSDYDADMKRLIEQNLSAEEIYETLAIADIVAATDILRPVYDATEGADGFVSLEVNPTLAHDTQKTIAEAKRLYEAVNRPNLMIKVPATPAGIPAIAELIGAGVNVNVTLIFSLENYREVAHAYIKGLETLAAKGPQVRGGHAISRIASVASFFVSRVDGAVDSQLKEAGNEELQGKIAIANAKLAYKMFEEIFSGQRWEALAAKGARVQRPLWASTSTKNPAYPDTLYVDSLIGAHTVNTLPPDTLDAFKDHGKVALTLRDNVAEAQEQYRQLAALGIDMDAVTRQLQDDGVVSFAKSFESLLKSIADKRNRLRADQKSFGVRLGKYEEAVNKVLRSFQSNHVVQRIWERDHTLWKEDPTEISNRLGWLDSPEIMQDAVGEIETFVDQLRSEGFTRALLLGMGGSSLAPEVFRKTFDVREGYLDVGVLDSTDPGAVLEMLSRFDPQETVYIVSTKSGGTVETLSFMKFFYNKCLEILGAEEAGSHFVAITDPGSGLESQAKKLKFRKIFLNDPNIGGRYSALSYFGLVPAAMLGVDIRLLLKRAAIAVDMCKNEKNLTDNTPLILGAIMGVLASAGRDKLTLVTSPEISAFGAWLEQLIAESTGKEGKGILPVDMEDLLSPEFYGDDRLFVHLRLGSSKVPAEERLAEFENAGHPLLRIDLKDLYDLGKEFFSWEFATAVSGIPMSINPFDQPNVESAKISARAMITAFEDSGKLPTAKPSLVEEDLTLFGKVNGKSAREALGNFLNQHIRDAGKKPRSYVAIQAYVKPDAQTDAALQQFRTALQKKYRVATTIGYGPRFLHSTGQLHKGDAGNGVFIQLTNEILEDAAIPDTPGKDFSKISFGVLRNAQALGDRQALEEAERNVIRIHAKDIAAALRTLTKGIA